MAQIDYLVSIQMNQNQLLLPVIHNATSSPTSPTPAEGQLYMNTIDNNLYVYDGTSWVDLTSQGAGSTNLGYTASPTNGTVTSSTGTDVILPLATGTNAGLLSPSDFTQLSNFADGDKGDITVSASGATWTIDNNVVTYTKMQQASVGYTIMANATTGSGNYAELTSGTDAVLRRSGSGNLSFGTLVTNHLGSNIVTLAKVQQIATASFLGRNTAATGNVEVLSVATTKTMLGLTGTNSGDQTITLTGDVTGSGTGSFATTIATAAVTNTKLATMGAYTIKINNTAGSASPTDYAIATNTVVGRIAGGIVNIVIDNDLSTVSASDDTVASAKAIKAAIDAAVTGALVYQGGYNASTNVPDLDTSPSAGIKKGWVYTVTADGTFFTEPVQIGDSLMAEIDAPTTLADWTVVNKNIPDIVDASETEKGLVEEATDAEVAAGTAVGSTGAKLFVTPAKLETAFGIPGSNNSITRRVEFACAANITTTCVHNLGSRFVQVDIYRTLSPFDKIEAEVKLTSATTCNINFNIAPSIGEYTIIVIG